MINALSYNSELGTSPQRCALTYCSQQSFYWYKIQCANVKKTWIILLLENCLLNNQLYLGLLSFLLELQ